MKRRTSDAPELASSGTSKPLTSPETPTLTPAPRVLSSVLMPLTLSETPTLGLALRALNQVGVISLAQITVLSACGLLLLAEANWYAVRGEPVGEYFFWVGLLLIFVPCSVRLVAEQTSREERILLLLGLGIALYVTKVIRSPIAFTFPDELIHLRNLNEIVSSGHLFNTNGILPATPFYPGLEMVTAALASLSGLSPFTAGLVVIGTARLIILLSLFFLYEALTGSARVASVGALLYTGNANYLFWTAQFSYESLSLPLAAMFIYILYRREKSNQRTLDIGLTVAALVTLFAVIITHHLTSYVVVGLLWAWVVVSRVRSSRRRHPLWRMALIATLATIAWLIIVATPTIGYLAPVFRDAITGMVNFVVNPATGRELFRSSGGYVPPVWERLAAFASVGVTVLLLPLGLWRIRQAYGNKALALVLTAIAVIFPLLLPLRLTRTSWEISNRTTEFVFLGLGFVLALGLVEFNSDRFSRWRQRLGRMARVPLNNPMVVTAIAATLFIGGAIQGWPPNGRLQHPYYITVDGRPLYPQGVTAANWTRQVLGKDNRFAADYGNARLLVSYGEQYPLAGSARGIPELLNSRRLSSGIIKILELAQLQYVLIDRRLLRDDPLVGIYFDENFERSALRGQYFDPAVFQKLDDDKNVWRVYDSGDIHIYQVEALSGYSPTE